MGTIHSSQNKANRCLLTRETSYTYLVSYARSIPPASPKAEAAALSAIATSLKLPTVFNFDSLLKLDSVMVVKDHQLCILLKILLQDGIQEYRKWLETSERFLSEFGIMSFCFCLHRGPDAQFKDWIRHN